MGPRIYRKSVDVKQLSATCSTRARSSSVVNPVRAAAGVCPPRSGGKARTSTPPAPRRRCVAPRRGRSRRRGGADRATRSSRHPGRGWGGEEVPPGRAVRPAVDPLQHLGQEIAKQARGRRVRLFLGAGAEDSGQEGRADVLVDAGDQPVEGRGGGEVGEQFFLAGDRVEVSRSAFRHDRHRAASTPEGAAEGAENSACCDLSFVTRAAYEEVRMTLLNWAR